MIIKVRTRSNGAQLGWYLTAMGENDSIEILEVDGREDADAEYLRQTIMSMEYNCELTKGENPFFIGEINPAYGEDKTMTREDWYLAAHMTAQANDYQNQRHVIVLHHKKGRIHAHVVWERYDHETGKLLPLKNSVYKTNDMRPKIEDALGHKRTSHRNPRQPEMKTTITKIWNETASGAEFLKATRKAGYIVSAGTGNRPFMVVDENGRSFNLVRQIEGVRTKDIRALLRGEKLMTDKQAIEMMRELQSGNSGKREKQEMAHTPRSVTVAENFAETRKDIMAENPRAVDKSKAENAFAVFKTESQEIIKPPPPEINEQQRKQAIAAKFADNGLGGKPDQAEQELAKQRLIEEQQRIRQQNRERKPQR